MTDESFRIEYSVTRGMEIEFYGVTMWLLDSNPLTADCETFCAAVNLDVNPLAFVDISAIRCHHLGVLSSNTVSFHLVNHYF
jgi:hypothetical protein